MNFDECRRRCIEIADSEGRNREAELFARHPYPTNEEWNECLGEVIAEDEDPSDPYMLMGCYEMRLAKRGLETGLGLAAAEIKRELSDLALRVGVPREQVEDAIRMMAVLRTGR